jgi:prevent-host-death family protein
MSVPAFALPDRPPADRWNPPAAASRPDASAERREEICRVGARLFAAEGVDAITLGRLATGSGISPTVLARFYPSVEAVLGDVLDGLIIKLGAEVGAAHDAAHEPGADPAPQRRLEAVIAGFIEAAARQADAYRALLFCVHRLAETPRRSLLLRYQVILESIRDLLSAAVPALAHDLVASRTLLATIRTLLCDPWRWHSPQEPQERHAEARRIAALLIATAIAETTGVWAVLGTTAGSHPQRISLSLGVRSVRARFCEIVKAAEAGTDISLTRHGRQVARIVGCGNGGIG